MDRSKWKEIGGDLHPAVGRNILKKKKKKKRSRRFSKRTSK